MAGGAIDGIDASGTMEHVLGAGNVRPGGLSGVTPRRTRVLRSASSDGGRRESNCLVRATCNRCVSLVRNRRMQTELRVLVADDHPVYRDGVATALSAGGSR
jgi:uncharacterized 2Fe-2S/4Fe-4S cluster protein (DUF4445 family)